MAEEMQGTLDKSDWDVVDFECTFVREKRTKHCVVIPVVNEGERIARLLQRMSDIGIPDVLDIIIADGGSTDGSLSSDLIEKNSVRALLVKTGPGRLSAQLLCAYSYCLREGYTGILTIDGNDKDDPCSLVEFAKCMDEGYDFVQGSRYIPGGVAENTPVIRDLAIRYVHAPLLSWASGFKWTDTTQGYRAYSSRMLQDPRVAPFRSIFANYELLAYLSYRVPKVGLKCVEIPTIRRYPQGQVPTKISAVSGNIDLIVVLVKACLGQYNPSKQ